MQSEVVFTVNSPGEVATWLTPVVHALRERVGDPEEVRVSVFVLPCTYAAGTEVDVVRSIPGVDAAFAPGESLRYALFGRRPRGYAPAANGTLLYLGGEVALAAMLARRMRYPASIYTEGYISRPHAFRRVFVPRAQAAEAVRARGAAADSIEVVGDLMVDAAHLDATGTRLDIRTSWGLHPECPVVALFPGSRPFELRRTGGLFVSAAAAIQAREPSVRFVWSVSPFHTEEGLREALAGFEPEVHFDGDVGGLFAGSEGSTVGRRASAAGRGEGDPAGERVEQFLFRTEGGEVPILLVRGGARRVIAAADLSLTVPGSNTLEMAAHGVPMIVCVPLGRLEEIPIEGVFGLVDAVPLVGKRLKAAAVRRVLARTRFTALPNRIAGKPLVPELRAERIAPQDVAEEALRLLRDPAALSALGNELRKVAGPRGAGGRVADAVLASLALGGGRA